MLNTWLGETLSWGRFYHTNYGDCHKGGDFVMGWETSTWWWRLCNTGTVFPAGDSVMGRLCNVTMAVHSAIYNTT